MSRSTYPLKLPTSVKAAAARLAKADGVSLNQFIAMAVAEEVGVMETVESIPAAACWEREASRSSQVLAEGWAGTPIETDRR
jgi:hypothetical protein